MPSYNLDSTVFVKVLVYRYPELKGFTVKGLKMLTLPLQTRRLGYQMSLIITGIGVVPITQLRTSVLKIVTLKGGHIIWQM